MHMSAFKQATGEAVYCDDMPKFREELYLALVLSTKAHANILKIDPTKALSVEGVVSFFSSKDIAEDRRWVGPVFHDEEVFVSEKVHSLEGINIKDCVEVINPSGCDICFSVLKICFFLLFQVTSQGQIIGAIVATDQIIAQAAAKMVEVEYENVEPVIVSIEVINKKKK